MYPQVIYKGDTKQEFYLPLIGLILISSIVIADPQSQLNLPDEFNNINVDDIFSREENMRQEDKEEIEWRAPKETPSKKEVRWGAKSIYEDNKNLDPTTSEPAQPNALDDRQATPQLQIRF